MAGAMDVNDMWTKKYPPKGTKFLQRDQRLRRETYEQKKARFFADIPKLSGFQYIGSASTCGGTAVVYVTKNAAGTNIGDINTLYSIATNDEGGVDTHMFHSGTDTRCTVGYGQKGTVYRRSGKNDLFLTSRAADPKGVKYLTDLHDSSNSLVRRAKTTLERIGATLPGRAQDEYVAGKRALGDLLGHRNNLMNAAKTHLTETIFPMWLSSKSKNTALTRAVYDSRIFKVRRKRVGRLSTKELKRALKLVNQEVASIQRKLGKKRVSASKRRAYIKQINGLFEELKRIQEALR